MALVMKRFMCAVAITGGLVTTAGANVEIGGMAGVHVFNQDNELGVFDVPDAPSQRNSLLLGVRAGVYFSELLGVEVELGMVPTAARVAADHYGMVDITYRAQVVAQFPVSSKLVPFVLAGAGAFSIVSSSNQSIGPADRTRYIASGDTDPVTYFGIGAKYRVSDAWGLRLDARLLLPPSSASTGVTIDFEALASVYFSFERAHELRATGPTVGPPPTDDDPDRDGIRGAADRCPTEPEDKDGFQDEDGCPDPDNDMDGILDAQDKCPNEPETKNGYLDEDGCPDAIPEQLKHFTGAIQGVTFKVAAADLEAGSSEILDKAIAVLVEFPNVRLEIEGHTDDQPLTDKQKYADNRALSQARADAVKAYLVAKGIDPARLHATGYGDTRPIEDPKRLTGASLDAARGRNRRVEFKVLAGP